MKVNVLRVFSVVALMAVIGCSPAETESTAEAPEEVAPAQPAKKLKPSPPSGRGRLARRRAAAEGAAGGGAAAASKAPAVGAMAPDIAGPDTDGVEFKLSDYRGKVVMLDFWGDW